MAVSVASAPVSWGIMESVALPPDHPYALVLDEIRRAGYGGSGPVADGPGTTANSVPATGGDGKGCPWACYHSKVSYKAEEYPETSRLLDSSLIVGSQSSPLVAQDLELMKYYADAFEKVLADKDTLIQMARNGQ